VKRYASAIAKALRITGPFNIQFMAKGNEVQVIECNLRASRTFPFVSKTLKNNFISLATRAMCGLDAKPYRISLLDIDYVCVKAPMFSFTRLRGADPTLGVEMASTGEVACFGEDMHEAFMQALLASTFKLPKKNGSILLSIASDAFRSEFCEGVSILHKLGYKLFATPGTAAYYKQMLNIDMNIVTKPESDSDVGNADSPSALKVIRGNQIEMVINISDGTSRNDEITAGYLMRRACVDFGISLVTNVKCAALLAESLERGLDRFTVKNISDFYKIPTIGWHDV
jgi:carbamoyl-phosphate synthase/aspartate carbamoyltransferase